VIERREHLRFALEARHAVRVGRDRVWQCLQRHIAIESGVGRAIHLAHAACSKHVDDLV
jgi:hypothetical protein